MSRLKTSVPLSTKAVATRLQPTEKNGHITFLTRPHAAINFSKYNMYHLADAMEGFLSC